MMLPASLRVAPRLKILSTYLTLYVTGVGRFDTWGTKDTKRHDWSNGDNTYLYEYWH